LDSVTVFSAQPIPIIVNIVNLTGASITVGNVKRSLAHSVSFALAAEGGREGGVDIVPWRDATSVPSVTLAPKRMTTQRFRLVPKDRAGSIAAGHYRLVVSLDADALDDSARSLRNLLVRHITIEVRSPETREQWLDHYLQLAYAAMTSGDVHEWQQWARQALSLNPDSVPALNDLAESYLRQKDCSKAEPLMRHAIDILDSGGDSALQLPAHARAELAVTLRAVLKSRCGAWLGTDDPQEKDVSMRRDVAASLVAVCCA
jgi:hypothetical protein